MTSALMGIRRYENESKNEGVLRNIMVDCFKLAELTMSQ